MLDKARLGNRFTCFKCGTKFYDLNRPVSTCPECEADQAEAPQRDMKSMLSSKGTRRRARAPVEEEPKPVAVSDDDDDDDDDAEELSLLTNKDDDDDGDDDLN